MDGVVDQCRNRLSIRVEQLQDVTARIVEPVSIIVVGDLAPGLAGCGFELGRLQPRVGFPDRLGHPGADHFQVFGVGTRATLPVREAVGVRCAVGMGCPDENVAPRDFLHRRPHPVAQNPRKPEEIGAHNGHLGPPLGHHEGPHREVPLFLCGRFRLANAPDQRQQGIGGHDLHRYCGAKLGWRMAHAGHERQDKKPLLESVHACKANPQPTPQASSGGGLVPACGSGLASGRSAIRVQVHISRGIIRRLRRFPLMGDVTRSIPAAGDAGEYFHRPSRLRSKAVSLVSDRSIGLGSNSRRTKRICLRSRAVGR